MRFDSLHYDPFFNLNFMISQPLKAFNFFRNQKTSGTQLLNISRLMSYDDYMHRAGSRQRDCAENLSFEKELAQGRSGLFAYDGYCYVCKDKVELAVDFDYAYMVDGVLTPNWRERLVCPRCCLNNRMRAVVHIFDLEFNPARSSNIYITEQATSLYWLFKECFPATYGSEYLGSAVSYGGISESGIRNEDLTKISFVDDQFDFILSFDVFEHIPNYKKALAECWRCIKPGGALLFTVPFVRTSEKNLVRAFLSESGEIVHLLPPEYHGDPINPNGCLCFYHFGWEILEDLKSIGFKSPQALLYWSKEFGYLGGEQLIFSARKE